MNHKPYLVIVTGRPGSGKTTFSKKLGSEIAMPVISRDEIKEGYVHTAGKSHTALPPETNKVVTDIFFDTLRGLVDHKVSLIAEAAFQHGVWSAKLAPFMERVQLFLLICRVDSQAALMRVVDRGLHNAGRVYFHGDKEVDMARKGLSLPIMPYEEPRMDAPSWYVDTLKDYNPSIETIIKTMLNSRYTE